MTPQYIVDAACSGNLPAAIAGLQALATDHAGTPPAAVKDRIAREIRAATVHDPAHRGCIGEALIASGDPGALEIGITLLADDGAASLSDIVARLTDVGDHENWEVREWAASALARVIARDPVGLEPALRVWIAHPSANLRRMAAVGIGYATRDIDDRARAALLTLLTPLMADPDPYVRKNLGPFALGSYALRHCPEIVAAWAASLDPSDEVVAWNLAMMFTTASGPRHAGLFSVTLATLVPDERRRVRTAVRGALRTIARREPAVLEMLVDAWAASPETRTAADIARNVTATAGTRRRLPNETTR